MKTIPVTPTTSKGDKSMRFWYYIQLNAERVPGLWYTSINSIQTDWADPTSCTTVSNTVLSQLEGIFLI